MNNNNKLYDLYNDYINSSMSIKQAAIIANCNYQTLSKRWKELGLVSKNQSKVVETLSEQIIENIYKKHLEGSTIKLLAKQIGVHSNTLTRLFIKAGLKIQKYKPPSIYSVNENFFKNIDTEEKAYFLGLLLADGCVFYCKKYLVTSLALKRQDSYVIERLRDLISPERPIYLKKNDMSSLEIHNKSLSQDLMSWGCVPRKTCNGFKYPNIPKHLNNHFIRGYLDGDGCVYVKEYSFTRGSGKEQSQFHRVVYWCGTDLSFLENIQTILLDLGIKSTLKKQPMINRTLRNKEVCAKLQLYRLTVDTRKDISILYPFLYDNSSVSLERKKNKMYLCMLTPREIRELISSDPCNA